jgi:diguanylate cyclase (GGDEF)-like protein
MKTSDNFYRQLGGMIGVLLGFGAPLGSLFVRMLLYGGVGSRGVAEELSGNTYYYIYMALAMPVVFGLFGYYLGRWNDKIVSQKISVEKLNVLLKSESMTDDTTGLYNHRHILVEVERETERARRYGHILSGMMIDIDDFKKINDSYGHLAGDQILREVADVLNSNIRKVDIIGRYGGDEFLAILPETTAEAATLIAGRLLTSIRNYPFKINDHLLTLTISIGISSFENTKALDRETFIERTDKAMFGAKSAGKNRIFCVPTRA